MLSTASPFSSYHVLFSFCFDSAFASIQLLLRFSFCLYLFFIVDRHLIWLLLLLFSTTDQTSHFCMRPVLFPSKRSNDQDSLLHNFSIRLHQTSMYATQLTASTAGLPHYRCDQDLRSVRGICCESGLRCDVVLISKSDVVLISKSDVILVSETRVCLEIGSELALADSSIGTVHPNPIFVDFRRFMPPFGARLIALSSSSLGLLIDTNLETGVAGFEEREVVAVFVCLRDCGPVVILFFNSFGFELVVAAKAVDLSWLLRLCCGEIC
ncbi:hypothetical protein F511_25419 [Dorcoceras hygrometricum]|uniref:Uncharacterized protein n=1 Tax=Dorcoceras hygrometricum TaxID=472368 RepID=A0A2Z7BPD1_9LAMI|nr:hypothetical protein F511_25419 [Dorcoceras hygrometricum]